MEPIVKTVLELFNHVLKRHPVFAGEFERMAAAVKAKGEATEYIELESIEQTLQHLVNHILIRHPHFAHEFELTAAAYLGKGEGAETVDLEVKLMLDLLKRQPRLAVDVGGNVGQYTGALRAAHPELEIHVFEPSKVNNEKLRARFGSDARVTLVPAALSSSAGARTLYSDAPGSPLGSLTQRKLDCMGINFNTDEAAETLRFEDYWIHQLQSRPIDMLKIDVEGHEMDVLGGFGGALAATRVLQFEFGGANIDTRTFFRDFWYFFKERGFSLYRISPHGAVFIPQYQERDEFFIATNYIAVNQGHVAD